MKRILARIIGFASVNGGKMLNIVAQNCALSISLCCQPHQNEY
jgi:hypothetical protein